MRIYGTLNDGWVTWSFLHTCRAYGTIVLIMSVYNPRFRYTHSFTNVFEYESVVSAISDVPVTGAAPIGSEVQASAM
ncbi:hypothetical protein GCM10028818_43720 [Spirosoma horti]